MFRIRISNPSLELGRGLASHALDFAAYRRRLRSNGKRPIVAAISRAWGAPAAAARIRILLNVFDTSLKHPYL